MPYAFANGSGTEADPYLVETAADLNGVRDYLSAHFKQTADIDLSGYENWIPIGYDESNFVMFTGNYNGNGFSITNLTSTINGLFSVIGGNASLTNINVSGCITVTPPVDYAFMVGSLASFTYNSSATFSNCASNVNIAISSGGSLSLESGVGGLIGASYEGSYDTFTSCCVNGSITVDGSIEILIGGFVGFVLDGNLSDCYALNSVSILNVENCYGAGFVGNMLSGQIKNCYSTGRVSGSGTSLFLGGFAANIEGYGAVTMTSCYYDSETSGQSDTGKGEPKTTAEMKQQATFIGLDFDTVWAIDPAINDGYPYLRVFEHEAPIIDDVIPSYPPASYIKLWFQAGDSEKYDMGIFYADKTRFRVGDPGAKVNARNSVGKYLRDQTYDERNNYSPMRLDDLLKKILTGAGITDFYVAPNSTQIGMQFAPNKSILDGIEEILAYAPGWVIREEVTGRVVIGPKDDAEFTQPSRYTFQRDRDIFSREQIKDDQLIYGRVCVHTTDFVVKVYRAVASSLGWLPPAQKTYYQSVPDGTTSQEAAALATELADSMANSGEIETFVCPFRPHLIPGDEAEILDSAGSTFLGVITQVQHDFGAGGFYTTITVDSGGRIGRPRFKDLVNAINSVTTISHKL